MRLFVVALVVLLMCLAVATGAAERAVGSLRILIGEWVYSAALSGSARKVEAALALGFEPDGYPPGAPPLNAAVSGGHANVVELLLDRGASVNPIVKYDYTPLYVALSRGREDIAVLLIEKGADTDLPLECGTALVCSARLCQPRVVEAVIRRLEAAPSESFAEALVAAQAEAIVWGCDSVCTLIGSRLGGTHGALECPPQSAQ